MTPFYNRDNITIYNADCIEAMRQLPDNSISSCLTDPPYGLTDELDITELLTHWLAGDEYEHGRPGFMGAKWDVVPGPPVWREVFRVMKPGGCLMAFGGTRTVDLLSIAIRLAGFQKFNEISYHHSQLDWVYGQGMVHSKDISKQLDKVQGAEREVVGTIKKSVSSMGPGEGNFSDDNYQWKSEVDITAPATPAAVEWDGYGTSLAPAHEVILCFWKPREGTYAENALEWGVAGLNVDRGRIGNGSDVPLYVYNADRPRYRSSFDTGGCNRTGEMSTQGRWPKNFIHDGSPPIMAEFDKAGVSVNKRKPGKFGKSKSAFFGYGATRDEAERICDSGSAARFYFTAKADAKQRPFYCHECQAVFEAQTRPRHKHGRPDWEHVISHPTQKPESLMSYLVGLLAPPKDAVILDPFMGSGTTLISALRLGIKAIGIDLEREFCEIAKHRLRQPTIWAVERPAGEAKSKPTQLEMEIEC